MWQEQVAKEQRNKIASSHLASSFFLFLFGVPAHGKGYPFQGDSSLFSNPVWKCSLETLLKVCFC